MQILLNLYGVHQAITQILYIHTHRNKKWLRSGLKKQLTMLNFIKICQPSWLLIVYQDHLWCLCRLWAVIQAETGWRCWCLRNKFKLLLWWGCDHSHALIDNAADIAVTHIIFPAANTSQETEGEGGKSNPMHSILSRKWRFPCFILSQTSRQPDFHRKYLLMQTCVCITNVLKIKG